MHIFLQDKATLTALNRKKKSHQPTTHCYTLRKIIWIIDMGKRNTLAQNNKMYTIYIFRVTLKIIFITCTMTLLYTDLCIGEHLWLVLNNLADLGSSKLLVSYRPGDLQ